ncbi:hypothetical protein BKA67DRAFT_546399 [Truncatella angustata]|uniref:Zn(2)-C6 fungal-type domain-containing protein n=1 Tax=Truncatella angustata TaxID=152316 RepID=A0A9P8UXD7_9PEZI|nr:uncharacterized protein BKA67DRAFT_546399 [Truncatella angustata]KAH6659977.1 hypothetical protein BKA67DRAFT_546399 [Truncatella angustata]
MSWAAINCLEGYSGISTTEYGFEDKPSSLNGVVTSSPSQSWSMSQTTANNFAYDDSPNTRFLPEYLALQPTLAQPSTRNEEMTYQVSSPDHKLPIHRIIRTDSHVMEGHEFGYHQAPYVSPRGDAIRYSSAGYPPPNAEAHLTHNSADLDVVSNHQRPPPAKRGPFKSTAERERTAETRKIGSCIRCRMQRIRCEINPDDKVGTCLTCSRVTTTKSYRLPCLRYKITDVRLFKPGNVKGHEWTRRWTEGIADDISNWASVETRTVCVTEGYGSRPVKLRVRQFIPQEGDKLERTWMHQGNQRSVQIPPYAIVNLDEAKSIYTNFINDELKECCRRVVIGKDKLIGGTYGLALKVMMDVSTDQKERDLLSKAFRLWMAIRMTTKSTLIVGRERLGMKPDIMDETSPMRGQIPLPPVMGAQIELVLIHQLQTKWRREMLDQLQNMTQANNHSTWLTIYLVTFILLHNVSLLCQHDAAYAQKHGIRRPDGTKVTFAREDMVKEYQLGANILLAYFHYCNKGIHPFSVDCTEQDLSTLAKLDAGKIKFIHQTRAIIREQSEYCTYSGLEAGVWPVHPIPP